jgi:alkanesulfonate monooxygenase SsuD/methylene tetrahydromethanopterin reductase-like flavin-dependent oxidoreductase (luciferase family)
VSASDWSTNASNATTRALLATDADPGDMTDEALKEHPLIVVGKPDEVISKIEELQRIGIDQVICFKQAGRIPHANIMRSYELMARYVLPHFRQASAGTAAQAEAQ